MKNYCHLLTIKKVDEEFKVLKTKEKKRSSL